MAGKFRAWAGSLDQETKESIAEEQGIRHSGLAQTATDEMLRAREDIRQKLVIEGWTGQHSVMEAQSAPYGSSREVNAFEETVWDQEAENGIRAPDVDMSDVEIPEIQEPEIESPDIEPE